MYIDKLHRISEKKDLAKVIPTELFYTLFVFETESVYVPPFYSGDSPSYDSVRRTNVYVTNCETALQKAILQLTKENKDFVFYSSNGLGSFEIQMKVSVH